MKDRQLNLILPKGRIQAKVISLLDRIGVSINIDGRSYRPACSEPGFSIKLLKPQNIPTLIELGRHDCGFTGRDWVVEKEADVIEGLDLGFDPVRIVAAVPETMAQDESWQEKEIVVASEYRNLAAKFIEKKNLNAIFLQTYGATEALPPEDADLIVDNSATGSTLEKNRLAVVDTLMTSSTCFLINRAANEDPWKQRKISELITLMKSALLADKRVLLEMNVAGENLEKVVSILPCMRAPTISTLMGDQGFALKSAVLSSDIKTLIPRLIEAGAVDILEYKLEKIADPDSGKRMAGND